jgi:hypothetical protein
MIPEVNALAGSDIINHWDVVSFFMIQFKVPDGGVISFADAYLKWVQPHIFIMSKDFMYNHLVDLPLWLLHAMCASVLV